MIDFTIVEKNTGKIVRSGFSLDPRLDQVLDAGEVLIEGLAADPAKYHVSRDGIVPIPDSPGYWHEWSGSEWIDTRTEADIVIDTINRRFQTIEKINRECGELRKKFITSIPGQDMIYQAKEAEATSFLMDNQPNYIDYPLLSAEVGITGESIYQVAQIIMHMSSMLRRVAAGLEKVRLGGIKRVEDAATIDSIDAAYRIYSMDLSFYKQEIGQ